MAEPAPTTLPSTSRTTQGRRRRAAAWVAAGLVVALALPVVWVQAGGRTKTRQVAADVPPREVALVLGAGLRPDGTPTPYLQRRLDAARELFERGTVQVILVSGDNSRPDYDEPSSMRDWLVDHGVPEDRVVLDPAGLDTHDSCVRAAEVYGVREAVVVTQDYHLPRAVFSCAAAGIDVVGLGVSAESVDPHKPLVYQVREVPASLKAAWDALTRRDPLHLGDPEPGVGEALAATQR